MTKCHVNCYLFTFSFIGIYFVIKKANNFNKIYNNMRKTLFDLFFEDLFGNDSFFITLEPTLRPRRKEKKNFNEVLEKSKPEMEKKDEKLGLCFNWLEAEKNWYMNIPTTEVELSVDEKTIEIKGQISSKNGKSDGNMIYEHAYTSNFKHIFNFPENSLPETVKARKIGKFTVITVDKAIFEKEENKRKKLIIE